MRDEIDDLVEREIQLPGATRLSVFDALATAGFILSNRQHRDGRGNAAAPKACHAVRGAWVPCELQHLGTLGNRSPARADQVIACPCRAPRQRGTTDPMPSSVVAP